MNCRLSPGHLIFFGEVTCPPVVYFLPSFSGGMPAGIILGEMEGRKEGTTMILGQFDLMVAVRDWPPEMSQT